MKQREDMSGQVMLTGAFILALALVFISLILNNVIYFNNVSYMGFMENSGHSDISIKNLVAQEAIKAYDESQSNVNVFNEKMQDLANSLNNITLPEGIKVVISPPYFFNTSSTKFNLTIYTKDSTKTYSITTSYSPPPISTPDPTPLKCKVIISSPSDNSIVYQGGNNHTSIIINVINLSGNTPTPATNQIVILNHNTSIGWFYYDEERNLSVNTSDLKTDNTGTIKLYWFPIVGTDSEGIDVINAGVGHNPNLADQNLSNNVMIINKIYRPCSHTVNIGDASQSGNNIRVPITIPGSSNFSNFSVGSFFNLGCTNVVSFRNGNYTLSLVTDHLNDNIDIVFHKQDNNQPYTVIFTVMVSAHCNIDNVDYLNTKTLNLPRS